MGIPSTGAYVGATVSGTAGDLAALEKQTGLPVAIHRTYFEASQVASAITMAKSDLAAGRLPWISFKLPYSWADMADGRGDTWATDLADKLADVGGPVWVAFHHEPEGDGPIQDWKRMQQHLAPIIHANAKNVAFTIIIMTWDLFGDAQYRPDQLWPGDQYVDVLGLDMYNDYGTNRNGNANIPMLDPMKYFGYFGPWAKAHHVPWALAETGYTTAAAGLEPELVEDRIQEPQRQRRHRPGLLRLVAELGRGLDARPAQQARCLHRPAQAVAADLPLEVGGTFGGPAQPGRRAQDRSSSSAAGAARRDLEGADERLAEDVDRPGRRRFGGRDGDGLRDADLELEVEEHSREAVLLGGSDAAGLPVHGDALDHRTAGHVVGDDHVVVAGPRIRRDVVAPRMVTYFGSPERGALSSVTVNEATAELPVPQPLRS